MTHTTHYACKTQIILHGGKAECCKCIQHNCDIPLQKEAVKCEACGTESCNIPHKKIVEEAYATTPAMADIEKMLEAFDRMNDGKGDPNNTLLMTDRYSSTPAIERYSAPKWTLDPEKVRAFIRHALNDFKISLVTEIMEKGPKLRKGDYDDGTHREWRDFLKSYLK